VSRNTKFTRRSIIDDVIEHHIRRGDGCDRPCFSSASDVSPRTSCPSSLSPSLPTVSPSSLYRRLPPFQLPPSQLPPPTKTISFCKVYAMESGFSRHSLPTHRRITFHVWSRVAIPTQGGRLNSRVSGNCRLMLTWAAPKHFRRVSKLASNTRSESHSLHGRRPTRMCTCALRLIHRLNSYFRSHIYWYTHFNGLLSTLKSCVINTYDKCSVSWQTEHTISSLYLIKSQPKCGYLFSSRFLLIYSTSSGAMVWHLNLNESVK